MINSIPVVATWGRLVGTTATDEENMTPIPTQTQDGKAGQNSINIYCMFSHSCEAINDFTLSAE